MRHDEPSLFGNLWRHRMLLAELTRRDVRQKYAGSFLGLFWAVIYPMVLLAVYTLVFGRILQIKLGSDADPVDFALYLFCGLLPWLMTQECMLRGAGCLVENANMVKKTAFPTEILPASVAGSALLHMLLAFLLFLVVLVAMGRAPGADLVALAPVVVLQICFCLGLAWFFAAANAYFRDVAHVAGAFATIWFLLTPIVYPVTMLDGLPAWLRMAANLNPVLHLVQAYRDPVLNHTWPSSSTFAWLALHAAVMLTLGGAVFRRVRRTVVDIL